MKHRVFCGALTAIFTLCSFAAAQEGTARRFKPLAHWTGPGLLYLGIDNAARFHDRIGETLPGRIWRHPGTRQAFAELWPWLTELLSEPVRPVRDVTGKAPWEILGLLTGEVALAVRSVTPGLVEAQLAVELGEHKQEILGVVGRLRKLIEDEQGSLLETLLFEGGEARLWPLPWGQGVEAVLGTHWIFCATRGLWEETLASFQGKAHTDAPAPPIPPEVLKVVDYPGREAVFALDIGTVRNMAMAAVGQSSAAKLIGRVIRVGGLHRLTWLAGSLGFDAGGLRLMMHAAVKEGSGDGLDALVKGTGSAPWPTEAMALVPAGATTVYSLRVHPAELLRGIETAVVNGMPNGAKTVEDVHAFIEAQIRVSPKVLASLPQVDVCGFKVSPPAGSLFDDEIALFPPTAFAPYRKLLQKMLDNPEDKPRRLESHGEVIECFEIGNAAAREALTAVIERGSLSQSKEAFSLLLSLAGSTPSVVELKGGWTAFAGSSQSLVRLVDAYAKGPRLSLDSPLGALAKAKLAGAAYASVSQGERDLLSAYNSVLKIAAGLRPLLSALRVEVACLPPAEAFLAEAKPGYFRLTASPAGFTLEATRVPGMSQTSLLAAAGGSMLAGFFVPTLLAGRSEAFKVQCANNMKQIYSLMLSYSGQHQNAFPFSPEGAAQAFQLVCNEEPGLSGKLFVCPEGHETAASADADGILRLEAANVSYEPPRRRIKNTASGRMLLYDRAPHHRGGRMVLMTDGSVSWLEEAEFQQMLEREKQLLAPKKAVEGEKGKDR